MHTIKTILIDDELSSLNVLEKKIRKNCPEINIVQTCSGAAEGIQAIEKLLPQLVFLDIEMPGMSGFTMLQKLVNRNFQLIFVTAYDQYAIKAIKFSALDYLLKPVDVDELKACVARVVESINTHNNQNDQVDVLLENIKIANNSFRKIALPTQEGLQFIKQDDILYLEAKSNYTFFHMTYGGHFVISRTLAEFEELLPKEHFVRIHNSYIIHKHYLEKYIKGEGGQVVLTGNIILDVSKRKKSAFLVAIGRN